MNFSSCMPSLSASAPAGWGGTFNRGAFAKAMSIKEGDLFPIISPVGTPLGEKRTIDTLMRFIAKSAIRKPWGKLFFDGGFQTPLTEGTAGPYAVPLELVRIGPSASNRQPWRVVRTPEAYHFYKAQFPGYASGLGFDIQRIDLGIAACHFHLSARENNLPGCFTVRSAGYHGSKKRLLHLLLDHGLTVFFTWEGAAPYFTSLLFAGGLKRLKKGRGRFRLAGVAAVGMAPPTEQALSDAIARNHLSDVKTFYLQGGFDINKLHGPSRLMMKTMEKSVAKKSERTQQEEETLDTLKNGMDRVGRSNLAPILAWMNESSDPAL